MGNEDLLKQVTAKAQIWLGDGYDEETKAAVRAMLDNEDKTDLIEAFYKDLEFGTGGLRGIMGAGTNRMNIYTVGAATQGLSNYLKKAFADLPQIKVAIGHDCRNNSRKFAEVAADVFSANGIKVYLFDALRPTPEVSFAIRELGCQSGVILTASHNPKEYNGYKAYWNDGAQMICGVCPSCVKFNKLVHPDVHFVFPIVKSSKGKREVCDDYIADWRPFVLKNPYFNLNHWLREMDAENAQAIIYAKESDEILKKLSLKSSEGGFKITILWLPEKMHPVCANKLLKLLEEPPEKTIFLLVSEAPEMILPTILSRTQRMNVRKIDEPAIDRVLQSKYGIQPADSLSIAHLANGNFIKALETIHLNEENQLFFDLFVSLMRLSYQRKIREMKLWSEQVAGMGRERQKNFLEYCQRMIRENFIFNLHQRDLTYMTINEQNFASRFAPFVNERNVMGIMDELSEAQLHIEQNVNAKMVFFDFSLKMIVLLKQ